MKPFCAHLADYLDGNLHPATLPAMEDHIARCPRCSAEVDEWRAIESSICAAQPPAAVPTPAEVTRLQALARERLERNRRQALAWRWAALGAAATAATAVAALLLWPSAGGPPSVSDPGEGPAVVAGVDAVVDSATLPVREAILGPTSGERQQALGPHRLGLGAGARLALLETDPKETVVRLTHGTVVFAVAPRAPGERFVVVAGDYRVEVVGTRFYVTLGDDGLFEVGVAEGTVDVRDRAEGWHRLEAGERLRSLDEQPTSLGNDEQRLIDRLLGVTQAAPTERPRPRPQPRRDLAKWRAWVEDGSFEIVELSIKEHLRITPRDAEAWTVLAEARRGAGRWRAAVEAYRHVIGMPGSRHANPARMAAALILLDRLDEPSGAAELLEAYLGHVPRPDPAEASMALARAQKALGRPDLGGEILRQVMTDYRGTPAAVRARHMLQAWDR